MKSLYFLPFISVFLLYSAYTKPTSEFVTQWKMVGAVVFALIAAAYWIYDNFIKSDRR